MLGIWGEKDQVVAVDAMLTSSALSQANRALRESVERTQRTHVDVHGSALLRCLAGPASRTVELHLHPAGRDPVPAGAVVGVGLEG